MAANRRFVAGVSEHPNQDAARRAETAPGQRPFAVLFGCSDSRLAAEIIFDRGLGDLFVVRTAGHVVGGGAGQHRIRGGRAGLSAGRSPWSRLVRRGRRRVRRAENGMAPAGYIRDVIERITSSVFAARAAGRLEAGEILAEHIKHTVDLLLDRSRVLGDRVAAGQAAVVGLFYRLADGSAQLVAARGLDIPVRPAN